MTTTPRFDHGRFRALRQERFHALRQEARSAPDATTRQEARAAAAEITRQRVAAKAGCSTSFIALLEKPGCTVQPKRDSIRKLARGLGVKVSDLLVSDDWSDDEEIHPDDLLDEGEEAAA